MMRNIRLIAIIAALVLVVAACGGKSAEEEILEQILENSGEDIGNVDINTDDGDFSINVEGEDGDVSISGGGDDDPGVITIEGEDGETMTIGGGEIPEALQLPVLEGGEVVTSIASDTEILVALSYPADMYEQLLAFYDAELDADSDAVERSETSFTTDDGTFRNTFYNPTDGEWFVSVGDCLGVDEPMACVNLTQSGG